MSLPAGLLVHIVTKVRPVTATDSYNNTTFDYGAGATRTTVEGRLIHTSAEQRYSEGRDADEEGWTLLTNETDIVSTDRIEWAGHPARGAVTFEVEGPPMPKHDGDGFHHTKVPLRIFNG